MACFDRQLLDCISKGKTTEALKILKGMTDPGKIVDISGKILLHYAADGRNVIISEYLIKSGTDIDAQNHQGKTALMLAVKHRFNWPVTKLLLENNAKIDIRDNEGKSALQLISYNPFLHGDILQKISERNSHDNEKIAKELIAVNCPVYHVIALKNTELTRLVLQHGCPIEDFEVSPPVMSTLSQAVYSGNTEDVKLLLDHGVDVNAEGPNGSTALMSYGFRITGKEPKILRWLLDRGSNPMQILTRNGYHSGKGRMQMYAILKGGERDIVQLLLDHNVDLHAKDKFGCTAVHYMVKNKHPGVMDLLKGKCYDVDVRDNHGNSPLHHINISLTNIRNVDFLMDEGADINAKNIYGRTPLLMMWVQTHRLRGSEQPLDERENMKRMIECLLHRGADTSQIQHPIFSNFNSDNELYWIEPVLAQLAIIEARGTPIQEIIRTKINENDSTKAYFDMCRQQLEEMKNVKFFRSITLYNLLIASQSKLERYVRNERLIVHLRRLRYKNRYLPYFIYAMRDRIVKAIKIAALRKKVEVILCDAIGSCQILQTVILEKITSYLCERDLRRLY